MPLIGSFALLFALMLAAYSLVAGIVALILKEHPASHALGETARRAGMATFFCTGMAAFALVWAALNNDFSLAYILHHTNRALPTPYKLAALWSGQEGSLLFWALLLSAYGFVLRLRHKVDTKLVAHASVILAGIQVFFLAVTNISANPFGIMDKIAPDGNGLNPLLQYPEMVIHPPMLYLGYVGFSVPFAFALAALIMRYPGEKWIQITRRWTMVTWLFLTCGIFLGSHWAYSVLGWGGYWGWDPVENASLLPWLSGTAFLHSVMMQEKRGMMKTWNIWLIFTTFLLSILGTFLTRSGVVASVHAFAQSSIGTWFVCMLIISFAVCLFFYLKNRNHLEAENKLESLVSRESSFLFNNLLFLAACFIVLWGTLFPILSEWVQGHKISVGPPFYNKVMIPVGLFLLGLTGVGPLLAWRSTSLASLRRNFAIPAIFATLTSIVLMIFGLRPWILQADGNYLYSAPDQYSLIQALATTLPFLTKVRSVVSGLITFFPEFLLKKIPWLGHPSFISLTAFTMGAFVVATILLEFFRGGRVLQGKLQTNIFGAMYHLTRRNTRRYGGYLVHFGVVLVMIGFAGLAFNQEKEQEVGLGEKLEIGHYTLVGQKYTEDDSANARSYSAILDVYKDGKFLGTLYPEKRVYKASEQPDTIVANRSTLQEDLYVIFAGFNQDTDKPIIKAFVNPLVAWLWIGALVMAAGTGVALVPNAAQIKVPATVPVAKVALDDKSLQPVGVGK